MFPINLWFMLKETTAYYQYRKQTLYTKFKRGVKLTLHLHLALLLSVNRKQHINYEVL